MSNYLPEQLAYRHRVIIENAVSIAINQLLPVINALRADSRIEGEGEENLDCLPLSQDDAKYLGNEVRRVIAIGVTEL